MRKKELREMIEHFNSTLDKTSEELKLEEMRRYDERQKSDYDMRKAELDIRKSEIASKNRVDISLDEYKKTMDEIASLESKNKSLQESIDYLESVLQNIGIPNNLVSKIIPDSIKVSTGQDVINATRIIRVEFNIAEEAFREVL